MTRDKKGRKACPGRPLPAEAIEAFVVERIREATASGALSAEVEQQLRDRMEDTSEKALEANEAEPHSNG